MTRVARQFVAAPRVRARRVCVWLDQDAHQRVETGMEMLRWQYSPEMWTQHCDACVERPYEDHVLGVTIYGAGTMALLGGIAGGLSGAAIGVVTAVTTGFVAAAVSQGGMQSRRDDIRISLRRSSSPSVLLTSTGFIFDGIARLWGGKESRLKSASLVEGEPAYMKLELAAGSFLLGPEDGAVPIWVPLPADLVDDARELVALLNERSSTLGAAVELGEVGDKRRGGPKSGAVG